ncbi:interleukin-1 receptor-associated kinase 4 [Procambarus clarkii]|uniref:interleukin-1 receptor-associated kinase 4 n=1 Tax=Procambarus clarkii TaxID=6728 RepID=UPI001E677859|nr:interleukin-1 receptor-associated kinase 4-like [Procambarus clarkii]XP_045613590.1 interleukin-1 receptor-associated kinase 4-like [Procambarus clarkii]XP_045613591.1 interleukin-1 receptor-associated kinase 4-like [Procambarus clarkii]XP_045613592.1 interleukin-1 receptor-associated kinase 4-like [Procambarus clarkii]XP_045613593.1 interleukin-1 receptor-associated kinase 4-like [Procambarus clarkii]
MQALQSSEDTITITSELRFLPAWARSELAHILEVTHGWREVMGRVPSSPWMPGDPIPQDLHYPRKYSSDDILLISEECARDRREGFEALLEEWGTSGRRRPTVHDLLELLRLAKLYRALDYLTVNVLHGEALPREGDNDPIDDLDKALEEGLRVHQTFIHEISSCEEVRDNASVYNEKLNSNDLVHATAPPVEDEVVSPPTTFTFQHPQTQLPPLDAQALQDLKISGFTHFNYSLMKEMTNTFSDVPVDLGGCKLGEGAFGIVYMAKIFQGGREKKVAVKRLNSGEIKVKEQFKTEIEVLSRCIHENLLALEGFSCDGPDWCLVYAYMPNGSLQDRLACAGGSEPLDWRIRVNIGEGAARGIVHLHTYQHRPLVHRDIKSANILLDSNFTPKVGDFGLVHLGGSGTHTRTLIKTSTVFGTSAYMAPEAFRGDISVKMDTFSFGIVLLEMLTGLPSYDEEREGCDLLSYVQESEAEVEELLDAKAGAWDMDIASHLFTLAGLCTEAKKKRPTMVQALYNYSHIINH